MKILRQLGIILVFGFAGELIARYTPISLPATVSGMILMLLAFGNKILRPNHIDQTADFLSSNMAFFLIPSAVTILKSYDLIKSVLAKLFIICLISAIVTFAVTYGVVRLTQMFLTQVLKKGKHS